MDIKLNNLIRRIATNDDEHAFRGLYYLYYDSLFRFAIHIVKREDWCEEIISDVFFHLWQNRAKLIDVLNLDSYIFRAVKNQALNFLEKEDKFVQYEELDVHIQYIGENENPEDVVLYEELNNVLSKAIESLPDKCRIIFKMVREDNMKYKQIADILGISVRTIDAQMAIAIKKIKPILTKYLK